MQDKLELFLEILATLGGSSSNLTEALYAIAQSDRAKLESFFSNVIDTPPFNTPDYNRLRKFLIDLNASHRTLTTASISASDPHSMPNSDLDELFRSFGFPYSTGLKGPDENPIEQKVQFFLDLVNLYKVKGTPQSLLDVLAYYGVTNLDIYEFFLKRSDPSTLIFEGNAVAGTTVNPPKVTFPFANITASDPHWLYTAQQILTLNQNLDINLPSKSPYIGIKPIITLDGGEISILIRKVQDEYAYYVTNGVLPSDTAEITYLGETATLLELYLSTIYVYNNLYTLGVEAPSYVCYNGTNTVTSDIIDEYNFLTSRPTSRDNIKEKLLEYYDRFTRLTPTNFLQTRNDAGIYLQAISPDIKTGLDAATDQQELLSLLLKDLSNWVKTNLGFGFVNFSFILFGIEEFFNELRSVINFFKPYRARIILMESLQIKNRLTNTILLDDSLSIGTELPIHDFLTGDSIPCCGSDVNIDSTSPIVCEGGDTVRCSREFIGVVPVTMTWKGLWQEGITYAVNDVIPDSENVHYICTVMHTATTASRPTAGAEWFLYWTQLSQIVCSEISGATYYSRDTYDCGSNFDYGAVVEKNFFIENTEIVRDHLRCPDDSSGFVVSEILDMGTYKNTVPIEFTSPLSVGATEFTISFVTPQPNTNYAIGLALLNEGNNPSIYNYTVIGKRVNGFDVVLSGQTDSDNYYAMWGIDTTGNFGTEILTINENEKTIFLPASCDSTNYSIFISVLNTVDPDPSVYNYYITNKQPGQFTVVFSDAIDSTNYQLDWSVCHTSSNGSYTIPTGSSEITIPFISPTGDSVYPIIANLEEISGDSSASIYSLIISERTTTSFTVLFSGNIDSSNYRLNWLSPTINITEFFSMHYYQTGGFRDFDGVPSSNVPVYDGTTFIGFGPDPDSEGTFDCTHGFDLIQITVEECVSSNLLLEDGASRLLTEGGSAILGNCGPPIEPI